MLRQISNPTVHVPADAGTKIWFMSSLVTVLITGAESGGSYSELHMVVDPDTGPSAHLHPATEEHFYILEGSLHFKVGDEDFVARQGDLVNVPRQTAHSFQNESGEQARLLATFSPAGMEGLFLRVGTPYTEGSSAPPVTPELLAFKKSIEADYGEISLSTE